MLGRLRCCQSVVGVTGSRREHLQSWRTEPSLCGSLHRGDANLTRPRQLDHGQVGVGCDVDPPDVAVRVLQQHERGGGLVRFRCRLIDGDHERGTAHQARRGRRVRLEAPTGHRYHAIEAQASRLEQHDPPGRAGFHEIDPHLRVRAEL